MPTFQLSGDTDQLQSRFTGDGDLAGLLQSLLNQVLQAGAIDRIGVECYD